MHRDLCPPQINEHKRDARHSRAGARAKQCIAALGALWLTFSIGSVAAAQVPAAPPAPTVALAPGVANQEAILDAMSGHEAQLWKRMQELTPRVETYFQDFRLDPDLGPVPTHDRYYLGLLRFKAGFHAISFLPDPPAAWRRWIGPIDDTLTRPAQRGLELDLFGDSFVGMMFPDGARFDRRHYRFVYVRREFLGEVRCYVFDVAPLSTHQRGAFFGRVWIEDRNDVLVRFNGTFWQDRLVHPDFHFDSWRLNVSPTVWLPAYIYTEESSLNYGLVRHARFAAVTQLWGYDLRYAGRQEEFTSLTVEGPEMPAESAPDPLTSPVASSRAWEHEAEDNVLDRLERAGLLAPPGDVERVLDQVVVNLSVSNNLHIDPPVRCRVLLTTPLESVSIGHTIVLSRGLIDALPDEASLAAMLAHELAHIGLGQRLDTQYAFADRLLFADQDSLRLLSLRRTPEEEARANALALRYLKNSPYKNDLPGVGLFLRELDARRASEPHLLSPHLGNPWFTRDYLDRLQALLASAPPLAPADLNQVAARPLGGRLQINPWSGALRLQANTAVPLLAAGEKMPLQLVPMAPYLKRATAESSAAAMPPIPH